MFKTLLQRVGLARAPLAPPSVAIETALSPIIDITDDTFIEVVLTATSLTIVDFWADWCQPCQIMSAYVNFLANDFGDQITLVAMDVDENPLTAATYDVMGLPTLLLFHEGKVIDRIVGLEPYEVIRERVAHQLSRPEQPQL